MNGHEVSIQYYCLKETYFQEEHVYIYDLNFNWNPEKQIKSINGSHAIFFTNG